MKKSILICACALIAILAGILTSPVSYSNEPVPEDKAKVNIKAPSKVKVGGMILIDLSESLGGGFDYVVEPTPPNLQTFKDGKVIVCGTGAKNVIYTFSISCALNGDSDIATHKIKVTGAAEVEPLSNVGKNIVDKVQDWASDIESPTLRDDALKLAQSFSDVSIIIKQGVFNSAIAVVEATSTSNRDALGNNLENWSSFLDSLMLELRAMAELGQLPDTIDHAKVWSDVTLGLREFANSIQ